MSYFAYSRFGGRRLIFIIARTAGDGDRFALLFDDAATIRAHDGAPRCAAQDDDGPPHRALREFHIRPRGRAAFAFGPLWRSAGRPTHSLSPALLSRAA